MIRRKYSDGTQENEALNPLIKKFPKFFSTEDDPITVTPYYMSTITQIGNEPVYRKPYPIPVFIIRQ